MLRALLLLFATILCPAVALPAQVPAPNPLQGDGRVSGFYTWEGPIPEKPGTLLRQETLEPTLWLTGAAATYRILYSSTNGVDGTTPVVVSGLFFVLKGKPPEGGWPLLAWAHETAGMGDSARHRRSATRRGSKHF
jgi:hypothetical protein